MTTKTDTNRELVGGWGEQKEVLMSLGVRGERCNGGSTGVVSRAEPLVGPRLADQNMKSEKYTTFAFKAGKAAHTMEVRRYGCPS